MRDLAALVGVTLTFLKWWEARENIVFGRLASLLGEQSQQTRDALHYAMGQIRRPGPADPPHRPSFAEAPLLALFKRRHWTPVFAFAGPLTSADRKLKRAHRRLDKRKTAAEKYLAFVTEQRFAAYMLQGAIASARSERVTNKHKQGELTADALEMFQRALRVPGKEHELDALELIGIHLRKLGQIDSNAEGSAPRMFQSLAERAAKQRDMLDSEQTERRQELNFMIARAVRYRAEMLHASNLRPLITIAMLDEVAADIDVAERLSWQQLLDRARFNEVESCIRVGVHGWGPQAAIPWNASRQDYEELRRQCDPKHWSWPDRVWRIAARLFRRDGVKELLREADEGLQRLDSIQAGNGCPLCWGHANDHQVIAPSLNGAQAQPSSSPPSP